MLMTMRRVLSFPLSSALSGAAEGGSNSVSFASFELPKHKGKLPIAQIKHRMELVLHDVKSVQVSRLQYKIGATNDVNGLWMLRSDMYQLIAMVHSQSEAARRINSLLPCFSQWISAKQLSLI
jgi:hypothetical protein